MRQTQQKLTTLNVGWFFGRDVGAASKSLIVVMAVGFALITAAAGLAQELDPRFKPMGTFALEIEDQAIEMIVPWDIKREKGRAQKKERGGQPYVTIAGSILTPSGTPGQTQFSVSFILLGGRPIVSNARLTMTEPELRRFRQAGGNSTAFFTDFELIGEERFIGTLSAKLAEMESEDAGAKPIPDAEPIVLNATIDVWFIEPN